MSSKSSPAGSTPHVKPSLQHSSPNDSGAQRQQPQPQQGENAQDEPAIPFPPPQTFDILPSLHALLARLLSTPPGGAGVGDQTSANPTAQPLQGETGEGGATDTTSVGSLDPKTLVTEASAIKIRIQKARAAVDGLPDIHRTVDEQQEEIAELERKIERLKGVIGDFGQRSTKPIGGGNKSR